MATWSGMKRALGQQGHQSYEQYARARVMAPNKLPFDEARAVRHDVPQERLSDEASARVELSFAQVRSHQIPRAVQMAGYRGSEAMLVTQRFLKFQRNFPREQRPQFKRGDAEMPAQQGQQRRWVY
jgi:hypothetical protein